MENAYLTAADSCLADRDQTITELRALLKTKEHEIADPRGASSSPIRGAPCGPPRAATRAICPAQPAARTIASRPKMRASATSAMSAPTGLKGAAGPSELDLSPLRAPLLLRPAPRAVDRLPLVR